MNYANFLRMLQESNRNDVDSVSTHLSVMIAHMLKFKYQRHKQSRTWITTIRDQYNNAHKQNMSKAAYNMVFEYSNCIYIYNQAMRIANKDMQDKYIKLPEECEFDIEELYNSDIDNIKEFLLSYAKNDSIKNEINKCIIE